MKSNTDKNNATILIWTMLLLPFTADINNIHVYCTSPKFSR